MLPRWAKALQWLLNLLTIAGVAYLVIKFNLYTPLMFVSLGLLFLHVRNLHSTLERILLLLLKLEGDINNGR